MKPIGKPCLVCGKRTTGASRCPSCEGTTFRVTTSCRVCGRRSSSTLCPDHAHLARRGVERPQAERVERQPWRKGYRSPAYHRNRARALKRAAGACERCGRTDQRLEVDHIIPLSTAKSTDEIDILNEPGNLQVLCRSCHAAKTNKRRPSA